MAKILQYNRQIEASNSQSDYGSINHIDRRQIKSLNPSIVMT